MSAPFTAWVCCACGYVAHPPRILCPCCASRAWTERRADCGVVTEITVRRPVSARRPSSVDENATRLVAVSADAGVRVIARAADGVGAGDRVVLRWSEGVAIADCPDAPDHG